MHNPFHNQQQRLANEALLGMAFSLTIYLSILLTFRSANYPYLVNLFFSLFSGYYVAIGVGRVFFVSLARVREYLQEMDPTLSRNNINFIAKFTAMSTNTCLTVGFAILGLMVLRCCEHVSFQHPMINKQVVLGLISSCALLIKNQEFIDTIARRIESSMVYTLLNRFTLPPRTGTPRRTISKIPDDIKQEYLKLLTLAEQYNLETQEYVCQIMWETPNMPVLLEGYLYDYNALLAIPKNPNGSRNSPRTRREFWLNDLKPGLSRILDNFKELLFEIKLAWHTEDFQYCKPIFLPLYSSYKWQDIELVENLIEDRLTIPKALRNTFNKPS